MQNTLRKIFETVVPFLLLGVFIALSIGFFIVMSYVLIWGLLIGFVLYGVSAVYRYFFGESTVAEDPRSHQGRIIEHDDSDND
jgi:hypothetical protein